MNFIFNFTLNAGGDIHYQKGNKAPAASGKSKQLINMQPDIPEFPQPKRRYIKNQNKHIPIEYCLPEYGG